jgi:adenylyltransferase/sulfurtransferase
MSDRFRRQKAYSEIGERGQELLSKSRVAICGMGALGAMVAERLCRMGVGYLRLIDRDWVELDNLPRQTLYTLEDALAVRPKAIAAKDHLHAIDPDVVIDVSVVDVQHENVQGLFSHVDCIADGTDNFETRFLINDFAWREGVPWIHAGVVGASGQCMAFVPGKTACFRCLLPDLPPVEHMQTCDLTGVLGAAVGVIASWQALEVVKTLLKKEESGDGGLRVFDLWAGDVRRIRVPASPTCPVCHLGQFDFLNGKLGTQAKVLCGKGAVQIQATNRGLVDLGALSARLSQAGEVVATPYLVRFRMPPHMISVFADGRAIVHGTESPEEARKIYSRWIGG